LVWLVLELLLGLGVQAIIFVVNVLQLDKSNLCNLFLVTHLLQVCDQVVALLKKSAFVSETQKILHSLGWNFLESSVQLLIELVNEVDHSGKNLLVTRLEETVNITSIIFLLDGSGDLFAWSLFDKDLDELRNFMVCQDPNISGEKSVKRSFATGKVC